MVIKHLAFSLGAVIAHNHGSPLDLFCQTNTDCEDLVSEDTESPPCCLYEGPVGGAVK